MRLLVISILLASCARLSPEVKVRLRAPEGFLVVRAPTPTTEVRQPGGQPEGFLSLWPLQEKRTRINVTSFAGMGEADPADLFMLALARRLNKLGYTPNLTASVSVRFESTPERWPEVSGIKADWVLHAQVDDVKLDGAHRPRTLRGSATLFNGHRVLRTTCSLHQQWNETVGPKRAWVLMLEECTHELLAPFEDT